MTTEFQTAPPAPPPAPEEPKSSWARLSGVLFSPDETFADVARRPSILLPLAVLFVVSLLSAVLIIPRIDFEATAREQLERNPRTATMSPADVNRAVAWGVAAGKVLAWSSPALGVAMWAIIAGILFIAFRLFGGEGTYRQAFAVTLYAWLPLLIKSIITTVVALTKTSIDAEQLATLVTSNPGFLLDMKEHPVAFSLLSTFDVFAIWTLLLFTIGFAQLSRMSKAKSATIVVSLFAVLTVLKVGLAAFGAMTTKAVSS